MVEAVVAKVGLEAAPIGYDAGVGGRQPAAGECMGGERKVSIARDAVGSVVLAGFEATKLAPHLRATVAWHGSRWTALVRE